MHTKFLFIVVVLLTLNVHAQDQDTLPYSWKLIRSYHLDSGDVWNVDNLENVYISHETVISKYDTAGVLKFQQSIKSFGHMKQLVLINSMKMAHFSEEQQTLCYLDNTLTPSDDCIELADQEIIGAQFMAASSRSDMIWIYDNVNSKLILLPMEEGQQQRQEILNVKGLLELNEVNQIMENDGRLYLLDRSKGIYVMDFYGGLLEFIPMENVQYMRRDRKGSGNFYLLTNDAFIIKTTGPNQKPVLHSYLLPFEDVTEFAVIDSTLYLRTSENVHKFVLQINK